MGLVAHWLQPLVQRARELRLRPELPDVPAASVDLAVSATWSTLLIVAGAMAAGWLFARYVL
jgi:hypothetical protein